MKPTVRERFLFQVKMFFFRITLSEKILYLKKWGGRQTATSQKLKDLRKSP